MQQMNCINNRDNNVLILMRKELTVKSATQEFKNAFHFSLGEGEPARRVTLQFSPSRGTNKEGFIYSNPKHFGLSHLGKHFKELENPSKSKSSLEGLGITIEDIGYFVIGQWRNNQIDGNYFIFQPNSSEGREGHSYSSAVCQYGRMKKGSLEGENYLYSNSGTIAKSFFQQNQIRGKTYIVQSNKWLHACASEQSKQEKIQCEIINFAEGALEGQGTLNNNSSILKIPKITHINQDKNSSYNRTGKATSKLELISTTQFENPQLFFQRLANSRSYSDNEHCLAFISRNQKQYFIGFLPSKSSSKSEPAEEADLTGFGIIFRHHWPLSYGFFKQGKLQGLGRMYESQMAVHDGFFSGGQLLEGFVIDYYANSLAFGHHSSINDEYQSEKHSEDCFIVTNTFEGITVDYVAQYKKNFHLKSLTFNNSYFNAPKTVHRSPWPYNILNRVNKRRQMEGLLNSFRPTLNDFQISSIQKQGLSSENRVEKSLLRDINEPSAFLKSSLRENGMHSKSKYIKHEISKSLREHEQKQDSYVKSRAIDRYVDEYNRIQRSKSELQNLDKQSKANKNEKEQETPSNRYDKSISSYNQRQVTPTKGTKEADKRAQPSHEDTDRPQLGLTQLINEYHLCQTERKKTMTGSTSSRLNSDRKVSPREVRSKRSLIREDHKGYTPRTFEGASKRPKPQRVNLDEIYHKYLYK